MRTKIVKKNVDVKIEKCGKGYVFNINKDNVSVILFSKTINDGKGKIKSAINCMTYFVNMENFSNGKTEKIIEYVIE